MEVEQWGKWGLYSRLIIAGREVIPQGENSCPVIQPCVSKYTA